MPEYYAAGIPYIRACITSAKRTSSESREQAERAEDSREQWASRESSIEQEADQEEQTEKGHRAGARARLRTTPSRS